MLIDPQLLFLISADLTVIADMIVLLNAFNENNFFTQETKNGIELLNEFANSNLYSCCMTLLDDLLAAIEVRKTLIK